MLLFTSIVVVVLVYRCQGDDCGNSYKLVKSLNDDDGFNITLTCQKNPFGSLNGTALFYRNGAVLHTDPCLNDTVYDIQDHAIKLTTTSECDGYYMCGTTVDNNIILSKPYTIHTLPTETGNGTETVLVEEGDTITFPCKVSSSPINIYETTWLRFYHGTVTEYDPIITQGGGDNSLVLHNVEYGVDQGLYYCRVLVNHVTLVTSQNKGIIELEIHRKFVPTVFVNGLTFENNNDGSAHVKASATENDDYPTNYHWEVNGSNITTAEKFINISLNNGQTKVRVVIWNSDYNELKYMQQQTMYIVNNEPSNCKQTTTQATTTQTTTIPTQTPCVDNVGSRTECKITDLFSRPATLLIVIIIGILPTIVTIIIFIIIIIKLLRKKKKLLIEDEAELGPIETIYNGLGRFVSEQLKMGTGPNDIIIKSLKSLIEDVCTSNTITISNSAKCALLRCLKELQAALFVSITGNSDLSNDKELETILKKKDNIELDGGPKMKREKDISCVKLPKETQETCIDQTDNDVYNMKVDILRQIQEKIRELEH